MRKIWILGVLFVATFVLSTARPTVARGAGDDEIKKLQDRIDVLEKTVLADPFHPTQTVLSRLTTAEDDITELQKHGIAAARVEGKDDETMRKSLAELQKDSDDLSRRLKSAEDQLRRSGAGDPNDRRDFKRRIDQLDRSVDDLKERVKQLEAKK